jgi:GNAT superfamily N-acetyltransferase
VTDWHSAYGRANRLWASLRVLVEPTWWLALSGAARSDLNLALCHGADAASVLPVVLGEIEAAGVPAEVELAGPGLAGAQVLADAGWVCIGVLPFLRVRAQRGEPDPAVRRLGAGELDGARHLVAGAFGLSPELAGVTLPDTVVTDPDAELLGIVEDGAPVACVAVVRIGEAFVFFSMACAPSLQRRGYGRRLLTTMLGAREGSDVLCVASPAALPLYNQLGFEVVEHLQAWSRPRWVLGLA